MERLINHVQRKTQTQPKCRKIKTLTDFFIKSKMKKKKCFEFPTALLTPSNPNRRCKCHFCIVYGRRFMTTCCTDCDRSRKRVIAARTHIGSSLLRFSVSTFSINNSMTQITQVLAKSERSSGDTQPETQIDRQQDIRINYVPLVNSITNVCDFEHERVRAPDSEWAKLIRLTCGLMRC